MSFSKMRITVEVATATAPTNTNLNEVRNAVAQALRKADVVVSTDAVKVEGRLGGHQ